MTYLETTPNTSPAQLPLQSTYQRTNLQAEEETDNSQSKQPLVERSSSCEPPRLSSNLMDEPLAMHTIPRSSTKSKKPGWKAAILAKDYEKQKKAAQMLTKEEKQKLFAEHPPKWPQQESKISPVRTVHKQLRSPSIRSYTRLVAEEHDTEEVPSSSRVNPTSSTDPDSVDAINLAGAVEGTQNPANFPQQAMSQTPISRDTQRSHRRTATTNTPTRPINDFQVTLR